MNSRLRTFIGIAVLAAFFWSLAAIGAFAANFASNGGSASLWSNHSQVDVQNAPGANVVSVAGDDNVIDTQKPQPAPESRAQRAGEVLGAAFWGFMLLSLIAGVAVVAKRYGYI